MTTLGTRLRQARKNKKLSQKALAELVGIKQQAVQRIERGDVQNTCYIVELAHALNITPDWLATGKEWQPPIAYVSELQTRYTPASVLHVPLLQWHEFDRMRSPHLNSPGDHKIPLFTSPTQPCFALQMQGRISYPSKVEEIIFNQDDIILVETQRVPLSDDFIITKLPSQPEAVFARYDCKEQDQPVLILMATGQATRISMSCDIEILGVVFMRYTQLG